MPREKEIEDRVQFAGMADDPFNLLGLKPSFDIDPGELQRRYLERAARLHPDAEPGRLSDEQAEQAAAALNDARAILADPEKRASALLSLLGGPTADADRSLPSGFLMEIMEVREQLEQAARSRDVGEVEKWNRWAKEQRSRSIAQATQLFRDLASRDSNDRSPTALAEIRRQLNAWRYVERLRDQLEG